LAFQPQVSKVRFHQKFVNLFAGKGATWINWSYGDHNFIYKLNASVDVICQHGRYGKLPLEQMIGQNGSFISILRNPIDQFLSVWSYYSLAKKFGMSLKTFISLNYK